MRTPPQRRPTDYNESSWEYTYKGKPMLELIDASGNYITVSGKEHIDHGTDAMKGSKICFTSAMNKEGEDCWQDPKLEIGQSGESVSDKGEKVTVKRVAYQPLIDAQLRFESSARAYFGPACAMHSTSTSAPSASPSAPNALRAGNFPSAK